MGDPRPRLPEPPPSVTDDEAQGRRLVQLMLPLTPEQRLRTLQNWARLTAARRPVDSGDHRG